MNKSGLLFLFPLLLLTTAVHAQEAKTESAEHEEHEASLHSERPSFTNGTATIPPGHYQLEFGYVYTHTKHEKESRLGEGIQLRVPLNVKSEVRLGLPAYTWLRAKEEEEMVKEEGVNDTSVSFKYRLVNDDPNRHHPSVAVIAGVELPTGNRVEREDDYQPTFALELHQPVSSHLSIDVDGVYNGIRQHGQRYNEYAGGLSLEYEATEKLSTALEVFRISDTGAGPRHSTYLGTSLAVRVQKGTQLDVNGGLGVNGVKQDYYLGVGMTQRW